MLFEVQLALLGVVGSCSSRDVFSPELDISLMLRFLCAKAQRRHVSVQICLQTLK